MDMLLILLIIIMLVIIMYSIRYYYASHSGSIIGINNGNGFKVKFIQF